MSTSTKEKIYDKIGPWEVPTTGMKLLETDGHYRKWFKSSISYSEIFLYIKPGCEYKCKCKKNATDKCDKVSEPLRRQYIASKKVWKLIARYNIYLPDRQIGTKEKPKIGDKSTVAFAYQHRITGEIQMNIVHDGGSDKSFDEMLGQIENSKSFSTVMTYAKMALKEDLYQFSKGLDTYVINEVEVPIEEVIYDEKLVMSSNMEEIIKLIMFGPDYNLPYTEMTCLISGHKLFMETPFGELVFVGHYHHGNVLNNASVNKGKDEKGNNIEPSQLTRQAFLSENTEGLKDLMGTLLLSSTYHDLQHGGWTTSQGIEVYDVDNLSYSLKSEENYNRVLKELNIKLEDDCGYYEFIKKQCQTKTTRYMFHKNRLPLIDEIYANDFNITITEAMLEKPHSKDTVSDKSIKLSNTGKHTAMIEIFKDLGIKVIGTRDNIYYDLQSIDTKEVWADKKILSVFNIPKNIQSLSSF